jgi:hypothetical protein
MVIRLKGALPSAKAECVAERVVIFRPHVGTKSVPQELGADDNGAWRHRQCCFVVFVSYADDEF